MYGAQVFKRTFFYLRPNSFSVVFMLAMVGLACCIPGCRTTGEELAVASAQKPAPTPTPMPTSNPKRPRLYMPRAIPTPPANSASTPLPEPTPEFKPVIPVEPDVEEETADTSESNSEVSENAEPAEENTGADTGEAGEATHIHENDPLLEIYALHGITSPMVANSGITRKFEKQSGKASFYWKKQKTASGVMFDPSQLTAAHKTLPFGTLVRCTRENGKSITVMINDRGPFVRGRIIDLSREAAEQLGIRRMGVARVTIEVLAYPAGKGSKGRD